MSDLEAVAAANQAFYDAHEARDVAEMAAVWELSERIVCVHPGWPILRGWVAVHESWMQIFAGPGRNQFILTNDSIEVAGELAWVTLEENLVDRGQTGTIAATNVFARSSEARHGWLLIVHHGSPVMSST